MTTLKPQLNPPVPAWLCAAGLLALLPGLTGCPKDNAQAKGGRPPPLVAVAPVQHRDVDLEVRAPLDLRPLQMADVGSKVAGYVDAVLVDRGDVVRRGQTLAVVRPSDLPDQLEAARAAVMQAEANHLRAKTDQERTAKMAEAGIASPQQLDYANAAQQAAQAAENAARAQVAAMATRLGETRLVSPMDGVVSARRLDPGALVGTAGSVAILTVQRMDTLRAFIPVNERDAADVKLGMDAYVELDALPGKRVSGKVVRLAPAFDPATRTMDAEVHLPNPGGLLRPGMYGRGAVVTGTHPNANVVPTAALQVSSNQSFVFVLHGSVVERRAVRTGVLTDTWAEITNGLTGQEEVVIAGVDALADKATVRVARNVDPLSGQPLASTAAAAPDAGAAAGVGTPAVR